MALYQCIKFHLFIFNTFRDKLTIAKIRKVNNSVITCDRFMFFTLCTILMAVYQCIKFHVIPFYTFRDMLRTSFQLQKLRREVIPLLLLTGLCFFFFFFFVYFFFFFAFCNFPNGPLSVYQVKFIFNTFRDMLRTSLLLQTLKRGITL